MRSYMSIWTLTIFISGANFHPSLTRPKKSQVIQKGTNPLVDAYSAFFDNQKLSKTSLEDIIKAGKCGRPKAAAALGGKLAEIKLEDKTSIKPMEVDTTTTT